MYSQLSDQDLDITTASTQENRDKLVKQLQESARQNISRGINYIIKIEIDNLNARALWCLVSQGSFYGSQARGSEIEKTNLLSKIKSTLENIESTKGNQN